MGGVQPPAAATAHEAYAPRTDSAAASLLPPPPQRRREPYGCLDEPCSAGLASCGTLCQDPNFSTACADHPELERRRCSGTILYSEDRHAIFVPWQARRDLPSALAACRAARAPLPQQRRAVDALTAEGGGGRMTTSAGRAKLSQAVVVLCSPPHPASGSFASASPSLAAAAAPFPPQRPRLAGLTSNDDDEGGGAAGWCSWADTEAKSRELFAEERLGALHKEYCRLLLQNVSSSSSASSSSSRAAAAAKACRCCADPQPEHLKNVVRTARKAGKDRICFHYVHHHAPSTPALADSGCLQLYSQDANEHVALPLSSVAEFLGAPAVYIFDCPDSGQLVGALGGLASPGEEDVVAFGSLSPGEVAPWTQLALPADLFSACLTSPIRAALNFHHVRGAEVLSMVPRSAFKLLTGRASDKGSPLGELVSIFTAITDAIAWSSFDLGVFWRLYRQDGALAELSRNFLLAERMLAHFSIHASSRPALPPTSAHHLWDVWDSTLEGFLARLLEAASPAPAAGLPSSTPTAARSTFFEDFLTAFAVWLRFEPALTDSEGACPAATAVELPIVLQGLLHPGCRLAALQLLAYFVDLGANAVQLTLQVGARPYLGKLLSFEGGGDSALEAAGLAVAIWTKIMVFDEPGHDSSLSKDVYRSFVALARHDQASSFCRACALACLACACHGRPAVQQNCVQLGSVELIVRILESSTDAVLSRMAALFCGELCSAHREASRQALGGRCAELLLRLLAEAEAPELRATAVHAVGRILAATDAGAQGAAADGPRSAVNTPPCGPALMQRSEDGASVTSGHSTPAPPILLGEPDASVPHDARWQWLLRSLLDHFLQDAPTCGGGAGEAARLPRGFGRRLACAVAALRHLRDLHKALLLGLGSASGGGAAAAAQYQTAFHVALGEGWPSKFSVQLRRYFRWTWRQHRSLAGAAAAAQGGRGPAPMVLDGAHAEEWWCSSRATPADRILALLDTSGRPSAAVAAAQGAHAPRAHEAATADSTMDGEADSDIEDEGSSDGENSGSASGSDAGIDVDSFEAPEESVRCFREVSLTWEHLGLEYAWRDLVMEYLVDELGKTVRHRCNHDYDAKGLLRRLMSFLYNPILSWLRTAHGLSLRAAPAIAQDKFRAEEEWWIAARRAVLQLFETFSEVRILEAFDMIRDFPDSAPALRDLRHCLNRTGRMASLAAALRQQLARRLLIAGAHTRDVIKVYIKTIKAMRLVDPRGVLLEAVSAPIRAYLRRRKDTVRCIVTALTEDSDLQAELQLGAQVSARPGLSAHGAPSGGAGAASGAAQAGTSSAAAAQAGAAGAPAQPPPELAEFALGTADPDASDAEEDPDSWTPDPIDADPLLPSRQRRAQDVISLLVGIYGSKEMFIKEYKEMLADRLLSSPSYSSEREVQNLELLKTRFGDAALAHCEVMLQDIKDSKRTNANVQQQARAARRAQVPAPAAAVAPATSPVPGSMLHPSASGGLPAPQGQNLGHAAVGGAAARPFMPPFSLSSIFGMCASQSGDGQAAQLPASSAVPPEAASAAAAASALKLGDAGGLKKMDLDQVQALVLSQHYWPSALARADHPNFRLPDELEQILSEYGTAFSQARAKRSLQWKRAHGLVEVTVELADRSLQVVVTPVHLSVLACFTDPSDVSRSGGAGDGGEEAGDRCGGSSGNRSLRLQEVANQLGLPEALTRKRIGFWVSRGVLREVSAGVFEVQENVSGSDGSPAGCLAAASAAPAGGDGGPTNTSHLEEDAEHSPGQLAQGSGSGGCGGHGVHQAELKACEAFVRGMLNNHSALPLARIHHFLQMFMRDPPYTQTEPQLRAFLASLCQIGKIEFNGSEYSLAHKN
eukprot:TRINITY_DN4173_c1_g2_i1.p1 TRINITY_DN4173_c1_g2~~TRINITY_DN4173_c1_g2_i1.p1  ORF type:complete len:1845 (+),score=455.00 TRINITY_DN4173_c1_g2_i1:112-5646(+)